MAVIQSLRSGYWDMGSTWVGNQVPNLSTDDVEILASDVVTIRDLVTLSNYPRRITLQSGGTLEVAGGLLMVTSGGELWNMGGALVVRGGIVSVQNTSILYALSSALIHLRDGKLWIGDTGYLSIDGTVTIRFDRRERTITNDGDGHAIVDFQRAYGMNGGPQLMGKF